MIGKWAWTILSGTVFFFVVQICSAQMLKVDQFLDRVATHPVGDRAEREEAEKASQSLETAPSQEVQRVLPTILKYAAKAQEKRLRFYALTNLLTIALRDLRDGGKILAPHSREVGPLINDSDAEIQKYAVSITYYLIEAVDGRDYGPALLAAMQNPKTPDETAVLIAPMLLHYMPVNTATEAVHIFVRRGNLPSKVKADAIRSISLQTQSPQIIDDLCAFFNDPDPQLRVASIMAFYQADRGSAFQREARSAVARVAADEREDKRIRQLARYALAGCSMLNPNILVPNVAGPETPPDCPSSAEQSIQ